MSSFRVFLMTFLVALVCYTAMTISNHGWNLFPIFFGDMMKMNWAGQFNFDFTGFLILSDLWTMWRNNFSASAIGLGNVAFLGGMMFLSIYLLYLSFRCDGNIEQVLLGHRAETRRGTL